MADEHMTPRKFLAKELRRARELKGMSTTDVAKKIYVSEPLVRFWENGRRLPQPDHLAQLEGLYGTGGMLGRMREDLVTASVPVEWFGRWPEKEKRATSLRTFQPLVIYGLLQTEDYARFVLKAGNHIADIEEMVATRLERQHVLTKEDPPTCVVLIAESVLRNMVGSPRLMHEQMLHLSDIAEWDNIFLHIVPARSKACAGFSGQLVIANSDDGKDVAYVDDALRGRVVEDLDEITRLHRLFDAFRADALPQDASRELIMEVAREWKS